MTANTDTDTHLNNDTDHILSAVASRAAVPFGHILGDWLPIDPADNARLGGYQAACTRCGRTVWARGNFADSFYSVLPDVCPGVDDRPFVADGRGVRLWHGD